jgi:outer membrane biosynthesis protein TonB
MFGPRPFPSHYPPPPANSYFHGVPPTTQMAQSFQSPGGQGVGFLSRLFGGNAAVANTANSMSSIASGQGLNMGQVFGMVQNAQKVIQTVQTVGPIVQQYGPLLKSLPQILQILKTSSANEEEEEKTVTEQPPEKQTEQPKTKTSPAPSVKKKSAQPQKKRIKKKNIPNTIPKPKLYI